MVCHTIQMAFVTNDVSSNGPQRLIGGHATHFTKLVLFAPYSSGFFRVFNTNSLHDVGRSMYAGDGEEVKVSIYLKPISPKNFEIPPFLQTFLANVKAFCLLLDRSIPCV